MISIKEYLKEVADKFERAKSNPLLDEMSQLTCKLSGEMISTVLDKATNPKINQEEKQEVDVIYLKNIKIWTPHNIPVPYNDALMELRIDAIDGFMLGTPSTETE